MRRSFRAVVNRVFAAACALALLAAGATASELTMKDGRVLRGKKVPLTGIANKPDFGAEPGPGTWIVFMLDDGLRHVGAVLASGRLRPR